MPIRRSASSASISSASNTCGGNSGLHQLGEPVSTPSVGEVIEVEIDGIMKDAAPFTATAPAMVL
jgi:hypothetical protein